MTADASFDVVIIGGAIMGSAAAWFIVSDPAFSGRILVVERDPTYEFASTSHTNSCIRQQFSTEVNIRISQFGVEYLRDFPARIGKSEAPQIAFDEFGYLYLAGSEEGAAALRLNHRTQTALGAGTVLLDPEDMVRRYPFIDPGGILLASLGTRDEGYFDGQTMFQWWRRSARARGVEYRTGEVVAIRRQGERVTGVDLADGARIACGMIINAAGPRGGQVAAMAGVDIPVAPRKRYTFVFEAEERLPDRLPLTIDPSGVHVRSDQAMYMAGCGPMGPDTAVDPTDFTEEPDIWEEKAWPAIAARVPAFERIRLRSSWVGHYAWNAFDRNALAGAAPGVSNFLLMNGFSGHGLQQSPAIGRGIAELVVHGRFTTLDLSDLSPDRLTRGAPLVERNVI